MAWDEFTRDGVKGYTGDAPIDAFAVALADIAASYEDQFKRKPTVVELLRALTTVLRASPERFVSDPAGVDFDSLSVKRDAAARQQVVLDFSQWEAGYSDRENPGYYVVWKKKNPDLDLLRIEDFGKPAETLKCDFTVLTTEPDLTDEVAQALIIQTVLRTFTQNYYSKACTTLVFTNRKTGRSWTVAFAG